MNDTIRFLGFVVGICFLGLLWDKVKRLPGNGYVCRRYPYKKKMLLTNTEYSFFKALAQKCGTQYRICPKVRMEDFISVTNKRERMRYRGYIKSRHVDFLLCDNDLHILAGIELDDRSHNQKDAKRTDAFKDNVFAQIGVPLFRIKAGKGNYEKEIDAMLSALGGGTQ